MMLIQRLFEIGFQHDDLGSCGYRGAFGADTAQAIGESIGKPHVVIVGGDVGTTLSKLVEAQVDFRPWTMAFNGSLNTTSGCFLFFENVADAVHFKLVHG